MATYNGPTLEYHPDPDRPGGAEYDAHRFFNCTLRATGMFIRQFISFISPDELVKINDDGISDELAAKLHEHVRECWGVEFFEQYVYEADAIRAMVDGSIQCGYVSNCIRSVKQDIQSSS